MKDLFIEFTVFTLCLLWGIGVTPLSISLSRQYNIIDRPGGRKIHKGLMPRGGGIVIWSGYMLWVLFFAKDPFFLKFASTGASLVFFMGYLDDMNPVNPYLRFAVHMIAAAIIIIPLHSGVLVSAIAILWIAGMISAYNLIDGLNGQCTIIFLISVIVAAMIGETLFWWPILGLAGGFLFWNFPVARTFLGDGGSTLLGFLFASHFIYSVFPDISILSLRKLVFVLALWGGIPVADTLFAILRRILSKGSPFKPDRSHIHHRLIDAGLSNVSIVIILGLLHLMLVYSGYLLLVN